MGRRPIFNNIRKLKNLKKLIKFTLRPQTEKYKHIESENYGEVGFP